MRWDFLVQVYRVTVGFHTSLFLLVYLFLSFNLVHIEGLKLAQADGHVIARVGELFQLLCLLHVELALLLVCGGLGRLFYGAGVVQAWTC